MVIRCERCATLYELDEALLGPAGAPVQCTKCGHVFTAVPPSAAGPTLVGLPRPEATRSAAAVAAAAPPVPAAAPVPPEPPAASAPPAAPRPPAASEPLAAPEPPTAPEPPVAPEPSRSSTSAQRGAARAVRPSPIVYRPTPAQAAAQASPIGVRQPVVRRDVVGAFESRLRWSARRKWLVPAVVLGLAAVAWAAWLLVFQRVDPGAVQLHREAIALLALDDAARLDRAAAMLADAAAREPKLHAAEADLALARVLKAGAISEPALASLLELQGQHGATPEIARALAISYATLNDREQTLRFVRAGRDAGADDPWLRVAEGILSLGQGAAGRERALAELGGVAAQHRELLRARVLLARAQADAGRAQEAVATLDGVLAANPDHEGARRLKTELLAPPPAPLLPAEVVAAPPEEKPGLLPRKSAAQPMPSVAAAAPAAGAAPVAGAALAPAAVTAQTAVPTPAAVRAPAAAPKPAAVPTPAAVPAPRVRPAFEREPFLGDTSGGE